MQVVGEMEYYLATAFEEIYVPPSAYVSLRGLAVQGAFLGGESVQRLLTSALSCLDGGSHRHLSASSASSGNLLHCKGRMCGLIAYILPKPQCQDHEQGCNMASTTYPNPLLLLVLMLLLVLTLMLVVAEVLEKAGIEPQVKRIGKYKSAGDQFARRDMSDAEGGCSPLFWTTSTSTGSAPSLPPA